MGAFLIELFPTALRGSEQEFAYNAGRGLGALFPFLHGALTRSLGYRGAIAAFALPETKGRVLTA